MSPHTPRLVATPGIQRRAVAPRVAGITWAQLRSNGRTMSGMGTPCHKWVKPLSKGHTVSPMDTPFRAYGRHLLAFKGCAQLGLAVPIWKRLCPFQKSVCPFGKHGCAHLNLVLFLEQTAVCPLGKWLCPFGKHRCAHLEMAVPI